MLNGKEIDLDPENIEHILRTRENFSTHDLETYSFGRAYRLAQRAMVDSIVMRPDTYLRPMMMSLGKQSKTSLSRKTDQGHFKVKLPQTWKNESVTQRK